MAFSNAAPQAGSASTRAVRYRVGIRFTRLGKPDENSDSLVNIKHWRLVFAPIGEPRACHTVEAYPNLKRKLAFLHERHDFPIPSFELAEYRGSSSDLKRVLEAHPARGSDYSACYNNCQHFAATFLYFLQAFANEALNKTFRIVDPERMRVVQSVLISEDMKLHNKPNILFQGVVTKVLALSGVGVAGLMVASEATVATSAVSAVTSTVPASGIAGWFGATTSVTTYVVNTVAVPAAYASMAAGAASVAAAATVTAVGYYAWTGSHWKKQTNFNDPRSHGFPKGYLQPLSPAERMQKEDMESNSHITLFGSSRVDSLKNSSAKAVNELSARTTDMVKRTEILMKELNKLMELEGLNKRSR
jgi:hypothetical protein